MHSDNKDFYDKNGYVILEKIFSDDEAHFFNKCIRRHANKSFAALINPDRYESLLEQDERPKSDITLSEIEETSALARSIMTDKRMVSLLDTFHGSKTIGLSSQFIFKEAYSDYSSQAWRPHQDNFYPKNKNAAYITLNWFLRDADKELDSLVLAQYLNNYAETGEKYVEVLQKIIEQNNLKDFDDAKLLPSSIELESLI